MVGLGGWDLGGRMGVLFGLGKGNTVVYLP